MLVQARRKWTSSTSASCVTTSPPARTATSSSIPETRPRRSSSASRPRSPSSARDGMAYAEHVDGPLSSAELGEAVRNRASSDTRSLNGRVAERKAAREVGGERGRVRAAGPVRRRLLVALDRDLDVLATVEEVVD